MSAPPVMKHWKDTEQERNMTQEVGSEPSPPVPIVQLTCSEHVSLEGIRGKGGGVKGQGSRWLSVLTPLQLIPVCLFKLRDGPFLDHLLTRSET